MLTWAFVAFQSMTDADALAKTWKVCSKVAQHLEQGARLENMSWRLWHLHNLIVEADNAKSSATSRSFPRTWATSCTARRAGASRSCPRPASSPRPPRRSSASAVSNGTVPPKAHYNYTFSVEPAQTDAAMDLFREPQHEHELTNNNNAAERSPPPHIIPTMQHNFELAIAMLCDR